jgi:hypothetical protein
MTERELQHTIRLTMGRHPTVRLFRNNVGQCHYTDARGRRQDVVYGLCRGSSDLIGWRTLQLPGLGPIAQFAAVELKAARGRLTDEQRMFIEAVRAQGGIAASCRSVDEVLDLFEAPLMGIR